MTSSKPTRKLNYLEKHADDPRVTRLIESHASRRKAMED